MARTHGLPFRAIRLDGSSIRRCSRWVTGGETVKKKIRRLTLLLAVNAFVLTVWLANSPASALAEGEMDW